MSATRESEGSVRVPSLDTVAPAYTCPACASAWTYQAVRNTGRCPSCGSGLLRDFTCAPVAYAP